MAVFCFLCPDCGELFDASCDMNGQKIAKHHCGRLGVRVFTAPQFCKDRQRLMGSESRVLPLIKNPDNGRLERAPMPNTRREYEKQLAAIGAEPTSPKTMPTAWKEGVEYKRHVETGGERVKSFEKAPHPATHPGTLTVLGQLRKSGVKIGG